jgi:hypothetical protein
MTERSENGYIKIGNTILPFVSVEVEENPDNYKFYGNVQKLPTSCTFELKDVKLFEHHERSPTK